MPKITFVLQDNSEKELDVPSGTTILEAAHKNDISLEGACEGSLACSTCHVIVDEGYFDKLNEPAEEEEDMLDLAFGLTHTSRLGCQITINDEIDGIKVKIPAATRNMQAGG